VAAGSEELLEVVVGAWQPRHPVAVEEPRPIAPTHLQEAVDRGSQRTRLFPVARHDAEQGLKAALDLRGIELLRVVQDPGGGVDPRKGHAHVRPEVARLVEPLGDQGLQLRERLRQSPLFSTRSRLL
jgi:hypothetical protein